MKTFGYLALILMWLAGILAAGYGYIHNIVMLVHHTGPFGILEAVRAVGIVLAPLGVVMGYVG